ncbi:acyltransferase [Shimazuella alba]|uniref:Acetyltransferase n=1 Tax=Shimazuella alba TaxID=2690964 RepID=A0A6I4VQW4_9BACL|nr:acyltransferase [Shimazuella alba]MXQ52778.1 acetyltransferase [Shimazuella alba]
MYRTISFWKVLRNTLVCWVARYLPFFRLKNSLYRRLLGVSVGSQTAIAFFVMFDLLYPEKIKIGKNTIIGYNTTILTHEYLIDEYRIGEVCIGDNVMIGANTTILPGVSIGDGAVVGAGSIVSKDVAAHSFVAGNPMRVIRE